MALSPHDAHLLGAPSPEGDLSGPLLGLAAGTVLVLLAHLAATAFPPLAGARRWFDVALENNVPTGWTVLLLLVLARRLWRHRGIHWTWRAASLVAVVLAIDEWVGWHEHLRVVGTALHGIGVGLPTYAWVLPGLCVAALAVAAATPWLRCLPSDVRGRIVLALLVFCTGALGVEALSGLVHHVDGSAQMWTALTTVEEALEMAGVLLAVSAFGGTRAPTTNRTGAVQAASGPSAGAGLQAPTTR